MNLEQKTEKHKIQMLICGGGLKADEKWMSAETSQVHEEEVRKIWWMTSVQSFEVQGGKFKLYTPFNRKPVELFEKFI